MTNILDGTISERELCEQLAGPDRGKPLARRTIRSYEQQGLPVIRIGGQKFYAIDKVREFIASRERQRNKRRRPAADKTMRRRHVP